MTVNSLSAHKYLFSKLCYSMFFFIQKQENINDYLVAKNSKQCINWNSVIILM